ncbi:MAG: hypothetical protein AAGD96_33470, partial [Chloroflexota bacterium]
MKHINGLYQVKHKQYSTFEYNSPMRVKICEIEIELETSLPAVEKEWKEIFASHLFQSSDSPQIQISASPINQAPTTNEYYHHQTFDSHEGRYSISRDNSDNVRLEIASGSIICFNPRRKNNRVQGSLYLANQHITNCQTEDITFTLLAPLLRLFSIYIVHAFGIVDQVTQEALLLVGPPGSGKTTSGLTLYKEEWQFLGNDAIFLSCN